MVAARVISNALRAVPIATLALLVGWAFFDILEVANPRWMTPLFFLLALGLGLLAFSAAFRWAWIRPFGPGAIGIAYFAAHAFVLGVQVVPALIYATLVIVHAETRILAERFAPIYASPLSSFDRRKIGGALARGVLRLSVASVLAVLVPILAADLAVAGIVPTTSIPTAILLAAALVVIVVVIALLPVLERKAA